MSDNAIYQIISAHTTGCLDKENFIQFVNYLHSEGKMPKAFMGELQNVIALVPTLLELEYPPEKLKNQLAKNLIELEEKRKSKTKDKTSDETVSGFQKHRTVAQSEKPKEPTVLHSRHELTGEKLHTNKDGEPSVKKKETNKKSSIVPWILLLFTFILLLSVSYYFYNENNVLKTEISDIRAQLNNVQNEIASSNKFLNEHIDLIKFFNYKNVEIVNFQSTEFCPDASSKLLVSFESGEGLLQLKNMPPLQENEVYQLWLVSNRQSMSLALIKARPDIQFYKMSNLPALEKKDIRMLRITKEATSESELPQGPTYLFGSINENLTSNRR